MADEPSGVGEVVMLGAGSIEHKELAYCYTLKSTTFAPPLRGPSLLGPTQAKVHGAGATQGRTQRPIVYLNESVYR